MSDPTTPYRSADAHAAYRAQSHFPSLDGVRCLAILAVVWHHADGPMPMAAAFFSRGYLGVDLFFVLSGFLITTILLREHERTGSISLRDFYIRRTLRIFPLYYAFLLLLLVQFVVKGGEQLAAYLKVLPAYLLYVTNWLPDGAPDIFERGWSLAVEEQFYLVWPTLLLFAGLRAGRWFAIGYVVASLVLSLLVGAEVVDPYLARFVPFRTVLLGCLLAFALHDRAGFERAHRLGGHPWAIVVAAAVVLALVVVLPGAVTGVSELAVHLAMVAFIGSAVVNPDHVLRRALELAPIKHVGVVSYGIYVLHGQLWGPTGSLLRRLGLTPADGEPHRFLFFVVFTLAIVAVATASYYGFERTFLKLKKRFTGRR